MLPRVPKGCKHPQWENPVLYGVLRICGRAEAFHYKYFSVAQFSHVLRLRAWQYRP